MIMLLYIFLPLISIAKDIDLINQEISQLEYLIQLQQQKLHYLKELRTFMTLNNQTLPIVNEEVLESIGSKKPFKSSAHGKPSEFIERQFTNRLLKKYSFTLPSDVWEASIIPTFQYKSNSENTFSQMLFAVSNYSVQLYDLNNNKITEYPLQFKPDHLQTSGRSDDPILCLANVDGHFELLKIENAKVPAEGTDGKPKTKFQVQITSEVAFDLELSSNDTKLTSMAYTVIKGQRYLMFSNNQGTIYSYHRNGTFIGDKSIGQPVVQLFKSYPNTLFQVSNGFGFINPLTLDLVQPQCENLPYKVVHLAIDIQQTNILYAYSDKQEIYVFEVRSNEQCKMRQKLSSTSEDAPLTSPRLINLRQYLIAYDESTQSALLFNTSDVLGQAVQFEPPIGLDFFKNSNCNSTSVHSIKGNGLSHYLLVRDIFQNEQAVSYYEVIMPQKNDVDYFSNFRFPLIIIAIVLVLLYQFWYKGSKSEKGKRSKSKISDEDQIEQLIRGSQQFKNHNSSDSPQHVGSSGSAHGGKKMTQFASEDLRKLDKFKEQLDTLDQKTKYLNEKVGAQNQLDSQRQKIAQNSILQNKKYI